VRLKVFHIIKSLGRGGAEMLLPETFDVHDKSQFEFQYAYFLPWKDQIAKVLAVKGAVVHCFQASNNIALFLKFVTIASFLKKWNADVLHCHLPWAGFVGRVAGKLANVPVVYTEHNKQERYHGITRWLNKVTFSWQEAVIAVSKEVADSIQTNIGNKTTVYTILNGVNTETFVRSTADGTRIREQLGIPLASKVVGLVAVFRTQKRIDLWLNAAAEINRLLPDTHFVLVGDGPQRTMVEGKVKELRLESVVHLVGLQPETRPYYAAFDLFFMTSEFEGLPVAMLEAMSMECPVVSTVAGGIGEVIRSGQEGLLFPVACSANDLANACVSLLSDPETMNTFAQRARERVVAAFSIKQMASQVESVYREVSKRV
jgi:L-malate glycosyltransferase